MKGVADAETAVGVVVTMLSLVAIIPGVISATETDVVVVTTEFDGPALVTVG